MKLSEISLIMAIGKEGQLGLNGGLPDWDCPGDLKRFKYLTLNKVIIVGRTTLESLPSNLIGRDVVYVTTDPKYKPKHFYCNSLRGATSLEQAFQMASVYKKEIMVIGGKSIYEQALGSGLVEYIYLTRINYNGVADISMNTKFLESYKPMFMEEDKLGNSFSILERDC